MKFGLEDMRLKLNLFSVGSDGCDRLGVAEKVLAIKTGRFIVGQSVRVETLMTVCLVRDCLPSLLAVYNSLCYCK